MEYAVPGICNRTVAVSSGYLTIVFAVASAAPAKNPEMDSSIVVVVVVVVGVVVAAVATLITLPPDIQFELFSAVVDAIDTAGRVVIVVDAAVDGVAIPEVRSGATANVRRKPDRDIPFEFWRIV